MSTQRKRLPANLYAGDEIAPEAVARLRAMFEESFNAQHTEWQKVAILDDSDEDKILVIDLTESDA